MDLHQFHHPTTTTTSAPPNPTPNRAEAERLLGIAEKLLQNRDLTGSREFALLAQETEPLLEGSDQILAITDVLIASESRVVNNRHHDWYAILQINPQSLAGDPDLLKKNYRRLALLLHPDKNRYPLSDSAFKLVADAWATLSNPSKKGLYDHELNVYSKVELRTTAAGGGGNDKGGNINININNDKLPVRRNPRDESNNPAGNNPTPQKRGGSGKANQGGSGSGSGTAKMLPNFWTACPYCYVLYEYPRSYEECCIRCQNCERAFHATVLNSLPPLVPGKEAYYCCWGFFPLGFSLESSGGNAGSKGKNKKKGGDGNNTRDDEGNDNGNNGNANHNTNDGNSNCNNNTNNPASVFPNWMPAGMFGSPMGGGGANMNVNMNASVGGVDISDGSPSAGFGNTNASFRANVGRGMPKKRGRPRKNPLGV